MALKGKLIARDQAKRSDKQHREPCSDCPFRRDALAGWLGGNTPEEFVQMAHTDAPYPCHTVIGPHCAGLATYRANICKSPRDPKAFTLPQNKITVFAWPTEFIAHHKGGILNT